MAKNVLVVWVFLLSCICSTGQDLNGFWKGSLTMRSGCFPENNIEFQLTIRNNRVTGNSYHYLDINNYVKKNVTGEYFPAEKKIIVEEITVTTFKIRPECVVCIKRYVLFYSKSGTTETISGGWTGHIWKTDQDCAAGSITLSRIKESAFKEVPEVTVDTGMLKLNFYDNNMVDGDSITVKVNGRTILTHQRLTARPITAEVYIDAANPFQEVEMIAENLGSIPPNTALLIITAGTKRYQLFLTSTEEKSARVRFVYEGGPPPVSYLNR